MKAWSHGKVRETDECTMQRMKEYVEVFLTGMVA